MGLKVGIRKLFVALASAALLGSAATDSRADTFSDTGFATETVATFAPFSLVGMAWAPDGRLFVWQKNGVVRVIKNGVVLPTPFLDFSDRVNTFDDRGFWGLAFHPSFATNGFVYVSYVFEDAGNPNDSSAKTSRLTRVRADPANPDVALAGSEQVILGSITTAPCSSLPAGSDCIAANSGSHTLGTLRFAPDGTLFVGNGDGADVAFADPAALGAQDLNRYSGKILRIRDDGSAPGDNPFDDGTNSIRSKVYLYGVRNPFRFNFHPVTGAPWFGDVGWNTWEEINAGVPGGNYGWPCYEGNLPQPDYQSAFTLCQQLPSSAITFPLVTYDHSVGTAAIGGPFYTGSVYPAQYSGSMFFNDYSGNFIKRLTFDAAGNFVGAVPFATNVPAPVTVEQGPDGLLYYLSFTTGEVRRIRFNGTVAVASATPTSGYSPLSVSFSSAGSTNGGSPSGLSFLWDFGDGTTSTLANPAHTYTAASPTSFNAKLTVSNSAGSNSSATVRITVGSLPPVPTISAPPSGTSVMPGQVVSYSGTASDPDEGPLPPSALSWTVLLHHNTHIHTFVGGSGTQGSFVAENHGTIGTFSYEIILTATDSTGLKTSTSVLVPVIADTVPPSAPSGLTATAVGANQINLAWTASTDNAGVGGYQVERCTGAGCSNFAQLATPTGTSFSDTGLFPTTSYSYRVRAVDASNNLGGYSSTANATTPAGSAPATGLVLAYSFNAGSGTTASDSSGNGNTGTINGATWSTQGRFGGALSFNGTNNTVVIPSSASLNLSTAMTLEAWIMPTAAQSGWRTVMQREVDAYFLNASSDAGALVPAGGAFVGSGVSWIGGTTASPVNAWTHLALTYDGSVMRLYVNGTLAASQNVTGAIQTNTNALRIGGNVPYGEFFQGLIDEVRVYNRALSPAEIQADMNNPVDPVAPDTTAPTAPTGLAATAVSAVQINLSWTAATDNVGVTGYRVERCQESGCSGFVEIGATGTTSFPNTGLAAGTTYSYRVRATDAAGNLSPYSNIALSTTLAPDISPPTDPSGLTATAAGSTQINLAWTASTDNTGVTGYRVERCAGVGCINFAQVATPSGPSFSDIGLSPSTSYSYQVRAADASGNLSGYSNVATTATPAGAPPPTGLVLAYGFNAGSGSVVIDASGNGNNGTINGATWSTQGRFGGSLSFNGTSSMVVIPSSASLNLSTGMTLSAWIMPTAAQNGWRTVMQREVDAYFLNASNDTGALVPAGGGFIGSGVTFVTGATPNPVNDWTHLALTYDGAVMRLYVNGALAAGQNVTGAIQTNSNALRIGGNFPYGEFFQGLIDEVRVYNRALSQVEIQTDMNTSVEPVAPDTTAPSAPTALAATAASANQINLTWAAATDNVGVTGYRVERCQDSGCSAFVEIAAPTTTSFSNLGLTAGTGYSYRVRAVDAAGNLGGYSNVASAVTPAPDTSAPTNPSGLTATASGSTQVNLAWTASTDNVGVTGYQVERCAGAGCANFAQVATSGTPSFSNTGLTAATSYSYRVRATDAAGNLSGYSNVAGATTGQAPDTTAPTAPTSLTGTVTGTTQINLTWTASTDNVGVTGYNVSRCQGANCTNFAVVGTSATTAFSSTGLTAGTTYRHRVQAVDAAGNVSAVSNTISNTTQSSTDTTAPTAPTALAATVAGATQINLTWTASTDNVGVTGYQVLRCTGANCTNFVQVGTAPGTSFSSTGLAGSTTYRFRVRATDAAGNLSGNSNTVNATTQAIIDTSPPTDPTGLTASVVDSGQINLAWTASTDNVGVTGYRMERCSGAGCVNFAQIATATGTSFSNLGLTASTSYSYRVRAVDAAGNLSGYTAVASATTAAAPPPGTGLVLAYSFNAGSGTTVSDSSGNGNTGTINGATWSTQGRFGGALSFNGTNNMVVIPSSASLNLSTAMTLEAWIMPTAAQSGWRTVMQREVDAYFLNASSDAGALVPAGGGFIGSGVTWIGGATPNPVNDWTHLALTYDGAVMRLYVNGTLAAGQNVTGAIQTATTALRIGGNVPYGEFFQGLIDEVRVYNRALSQAEIQADMSAPVAP